MADSDRELLGWAAKAAGGEFLCCEVGVENPCWYFIDTTTRSIWSPRTDDGDAMRLAVRLQLTVCNEHLNAGVVYCTRGEEVFTEVASGTRTDVEVLQEDYAATRLAIVMAAAAIGKGEKS